MKQIEKEIIDKHRETSMFMNTSALFVWSNDHQIDSNSFWGQIFSAYPKVLSVFVSMVYMGIIFYSDKLTPIMGFAKILGPWTSPRSEPRDGNQANEGAQNNYLDNFKFA